MDQSYKGAFEVRAKDKEKILLSLVKRVEVLEKAIKKPAAKRTSKKV